MTSKRVHLMLIAVIGLLFAGLLGGAYGVNNLLSTQAQKLTALKAKNLALDQEQLSLNKAKKDIRTYDSLDKIARSVVPQDKNQAEAVREIVNIAAANGVKLAAINFPASTLGFKPAGSANSASGKATVTTTPAAGSGNTKAAGLSQLLPVTNIPGIYQLQITVNSDPNQPVLYDKFTGFLDALEHNRRTSQVATITLSPDAKRPAYLTFTLTLNEYIKP